MDEAFQREVLDRLERIELQARATNGRLRELERWRAYTEGLRAGVGGLWHVALGLIGGLTGMVGVIIAAIAVMR